MLEVGRNCWRIAKANRAAFLIDGDAYFSALRHAIARARNRVVLVGWDIDSRVRLTRPSEAPPLTLLDFLNETLARQPDLRIYALGWDYSVIFTLEREPLPAFRFAWNAHPRLAFSLDDAHPFSGAHHQKILAVDGTLAFAGGMDLAIRRWDTPAHRAEDPDRVDPSGRPYPPMHDVQMMVDGEAAGALDELVRERWRKATGAEIPTGPGASAEDLWQEGLPPDATDTPVGIARTLPPLEGTPAVQEVATLTLDAIAAARRSIYIENQYLTSAAAAAAIARRLTETDGPEVVIILPREEHGWLEQSSMGIMRSRVLTRLTESDRHGRLRLLHPTVPGLEAGCINVHAKVMVIDETIARVGSANLSNRSMGLDTECDLVLDAELDPRQKDPVEKLRNTLLAEHLGSSPHAVAEAIRTRGSLIRAIDALNGGPRKLVPLPMPPPPGELEAAGPPLDLTFLDGLVCDPERPAPDKLLATFVPDGLRRPVHRSLTGWVLLLGAILAVVALWRFTPLRSYLEVDKIAALGRALRDDPAAPIWVLLGYLVGGVVFFPITLLLGATALVFPLPASIIYCWGGTLAGAAITYWLGRLAGRLHISWIRGPRMVKVRRQLRHRGVLAIVAARIIPVGNFSLINMTAGALGIRFRDFMLGNALGVLPGVLTLTVFADRLGTTLRQPHARNMFALALVAFGLLGLMWWLRRRLARRDA